MLSKEYGQTNTFMSIMLMAKITLDMWMWGPFHNTSGIVVNWENVWTNTYVKCTKSCKKKQPIFAYKRNSIEKETSNIFDCTRWSFLQSLISTILCSKRKFKFHYYKLTVLSKLYFILFETCFWRYYVIAVI